MKTLEEAVIQKVEQELGLQFLADSANANLCYRNTNSDLRDEFKETFTENDIECFISSFNFEELMIPDDRLKFWERVQKGKLNG